MEALRKNIVVYYDAHCNMCSGVVQFIKFFNQATLLNFMPFQAVITDPLQYSELIVVNNNNEFKASAGVILVLKTMKGIPAYLAILLELFPISFLDKIYYYIALNRYKWFGKTKTCPVH